MQFLMILSDVETEQRGPSDPGFQDLMSEYAAFGELVEKLGAFVAAGRLQPTATAKTVRVREGKTLTSDGPFAETKEQLGGFYLLECRDQAQALELAAKIPTAKTGSVEVRPIFG